MSAGKNKQTMKSRSSSSAASEESHQTVHFSKVSLKQGETYKLLVIQPGGQWKKITATTSLILA